MLHGADGRSALPLMDEAEFTSRLHQIADVSRTPVPEGDKQIFQHKYRARALLVALQAELLPQESSGPVAAAQLAQVSLALGANHVESEEMGAGQEHLNAALKRLNAVRGHPAIDEEGVPPPNGAGAPVDGRWDHALLETCNHLGVLWSGRGDNRKARGFLKAAEQLYLTNIDGCDDERRGVFEERFLQTAFYLAQVEAHLGDKVASARYCMTTLQKQLLLRKEFDRSEWTTNCLHLSGYFLEREDFSLADYCIRAAHYVLAEQTGEKDERIEANLQVATGKYHSHILRVSYRRLEAGEEADLVTRPQDGIFALPIAAPLAHLPLVRTFDAAREVFKAALPPLERSLHHYTFEGECTFHIDIQSDISVLWKLLLQYESDLERRISMHKRRIALYEPLVGHLQVQCYMSYVRKLTYELGEIWNEIVDLRQLQLQRGVHVGPKKINEAGRASIRYHELFLATFLPDQQTNQSCELPECDTSKQPGPKELEEDYHRTFVMANLQIARQYTRLQCDDFKEAAQRIMAARDRYLYILECAKKYGAQGLA